MLRLPLTPAALLNSTATQAALGRVVGNQGILVYEDFSLHADTEPGEVFSPILGAPWEFLAAGGEDSSDAPYIEDGVLRGAVGNPNIFYAKQELDIEPDEVGAVIEFVSAGGASTQTTFTIAVGDFGAGWEGGFVHMSWLRDQIGVGTGFYSAATGLVLNPQKTYMLPANLAADVQHTLRARRDGANLVLTVGEYAVRIADAEVTQWWGKNVFFEHYYYAAADIAYEVRSHKWWVARNNVALPDSTPAVESMGATFFPYDATGAARAKSPLGTLTRIGTGTYTGGFCCVVPDGQTLTNYENGVLMLGDASGNDNTGTGPQARFVQNGSAGTPALQIWHQDGVNNTRWCFTGFGAGELLSFWWGRDADGAMFFVQNGELVQPYDTIVSGAGAAVAVNIDDQFLNVGSTGQRSFHGQILYVGWANFAVPRSMLTRLARSWRVPPRFQWATNATLNNGTLTVGKCYRIVAQAVAGYWYAGSAVGQEFMVTSATTAYDLKSRAEYVLLQTAITANETVVQLGFLALLDGTQGYGSAMWDLSSNAQHAVWAGAVAHVKPTSLPSPLTTLVPLANEVAIVTATATNVVSRVLTAGTWLVEANLNFRLAAATVTSMRAGITTASATLPNDGTEVYSALQTNTLSASHSLMPRGKVITVAAGATATVYLVGYAVFSAGAVTGFGSISATPLATN